MREITDPAAVRAVLNDPACTVPPVPDAASGVAWLRATVGRFSTGEAWHRRRALSEAAIATARTRAARTLANGDLPGARRQNRHPVAILAGRDDVVPLVEDVAQAYQPGTGDEQRADAAVEHLITLLGGAHEEPTAARIGMLVQACIPTTLLIDRSRDTPIAEVLRDSPPVAATKRITGAGELVSLSLSGDLAFGDGPRRCPGRDLALALTEALAETLTETRTREARTPGT